MLGLTMMVLWIGMSGIIMTVAVLVIRIVSVRDDCLATSRRVYKNHGLCVIAAESLQVQ